MNVWPKKSTGAKNAATARATPPDAIALSRLTRTAARAPRDQNTAVQARKRNVIESAHGDVPVVGRYRQGARAIAEHHALRLLRSGGQPLRGDPDRAVAGRRVDRE